MEYIEIVLQDVQVQQIEEVFKNYFVFSETDIIRSHFFDSKRNADAEYSDIVSLNEHFRVAGTGMIFVRKLKIGLELFDVLFLIASDGNQCDITLNFTCEQVAEALIRNDFDELTPLVRKLVEIQINMKLKKILIGYEPAIDLDMRIAEISDGEFKIYGP